MQDFSCAIEHFARVLVQTCTVVDFVVLMSAGGAAVGGGGAGGEVAVDVEAGATMGAGDGGVWRRRRRKRKRGMMRRGEGFATIRACRLLLLLRHLDEAGAGHAGCVGGGVGVVAEVSVGSFIYPENRKRKKKLLLLLLLLSPVLPDYYSYCGGKKRRRVGEFRAGVGSTWCVCE